MNKEIILIGAGPMAQEYAKVLTDLGKKFIVVGRGAKSAKNFQKNTGIPVKTGGINNWLDNNPSFDTAIVAVGEKDLGTSTKSLISAGIKNILVEKPGGFTADDILGVGKLAKEKAANVYVGYNRRFYASTQKAREIISKDGGILSFIFEFTEWGHKIPQSKIDSGVTQEWFLQNSTHVIDLAFFLGGKPEKISTYTASGTSWHKHASIYSGAGITENNALFSYSANWESAGRWGIEIMTKKHKLILRPLEKLQIQNIGSVETEFAAIDDGLDIQYKPGIYRQTESFLGDKKYLLPIHEQIEMLKFYTLINNPVHL